MWEGGSITAEGGIVDLVDKDAEERSGLVVWVLLEVGVDLYDECGADGGEETSLSPLLKNVRTNFIQTHEDQRVVQIFIMLLHEVLVVPLSLHVVVPEELSPMPLLSG